MGMQICTLDLEWVSSQRESLEPLPIGSISIPGALSRVLPISLSESRSNMCGSMAPLIEANMYELETFTSEGWRHRRLVASAISRMVCASESLDLCDFG
jgi:hypothetical protein